MRVLIVYPRFQFYGGAELLIVRLANHFSQKGIPHAVLTAELQPEIEKEFHRTEVILAKGSSASASCGFRGAVAAFLSIRSALRKEINRFDLINVHNYPSELCTFPISKPVVWMCNEPPEVAVNVRTLDTASTIWKRMAYRSFLFAERQVVRNYITSVVVADEFNRSRFERLYGFAPSVINYGIDSDFFSHGSVVATPRDPSGFTLLHVGMVTPLKNQIESIKTIEALMGAVSGIRLILAGKDDGPYAQSLHRYVRDKGLEHRVTFSGHITRDNLRRLLFSADVLIHPVKSQGGWLSPFEALCAGTPIIVSNEMTASQIIRKNDIGVVTDNFPEAVSSVYRNLSEYRKMADRGRQWVSRNLSWERFAEEMLQVFLSALQRHRKFRGRTQRPVLL